MVPWYNKNTETDDKPRLLVRRSELPASDAARGFAEISTDDCAMSDPQWRKSGSENCRKVARLHTEQREDVLFAALRLCGLPDFFGGYAYETHHKSSIHSADGIYRSNHNLTRKLNKMSIKSLYCVYLYTDQQGILQLFCGKKLCKNAPKTGP